MKNDIGHRGIDKGVSKLGEVEGVYTFGQMRYLTGNGNTEDGLYFYHGNHLSSTQLITDINANISQAVLYTPWGSVIKEYKADWMLDTIPRYLFNAKELDEESGMYYYEARYYAPPSFISRDPVFQEYPATSPYAYCMNNPVKLIDPDGRRVFAHDKTSKKYMKSYFKEQFGTSKMFRFNSHGELKINKGRFNKTMASANPYQKTLLGGMEKAIKSNDVAKVIVNENSNTFKFKDPQVTGYNENGFPIYNDNGGTVTWNGEGFAAQAANMSYTMIGINHTASENAALTTDATRTIGKDDIVSTTTGKSASAMFMHELLDEFLNFYSGKNVDKSSPQIDKVFYQNAALQNQGRPPRNGTDHEE
jgi:RHS repeat-associated protein